MSLVNARIDLGRLTSITNSLSFGALIGEATEFSLLSLYQKDLLMSCAQRVLLFACLFPSFVFSSPIAKRAELMAVYRQAVSHNSDLAAARADYAAQQELLPQARANLLPVIDRKSVV